MDADTGTCHPCDKGDRLRTGTPADALCRPGRCISLEGLPRGSHSDSAVAGHSGTSCPMAQPRQRGACMAKMPATWTSNELLAERRRMKITASAPPRRSSATLHMTTRCAAADPATSVSVKPTRQYVMISKRLAIGSVLISALVASNSSVPTAYSPQMRDNVGQQTSKAHMMRAFHFVLSTRQSPDAQMNGSMFMMFTPTPALIHAASPRSDTIAIGKTVPARCPRRDVSWLMRPRTRTQGRAGG